MGTKQIPSPFDAYDKALPDEPMFILLARDASAPHMVRQWAYEREREVAQCRRPEADLAMVAEARCCANVMALWREENFDAWRQDEPKVPAAPKTAESAEVST